jgi:chemotaxis signal transduction protein
VSSTARGELRLLRFGVGGERCALPLSAISEVVHLPRLATPPGLPWFAAGVFDLRGRTLAVVRADRLLGLAEQAPGLYSPLLVVRASGTLLGLLAHRVFDVVTVDAGRLQHVAAGQAFNNCLHAELDAEDGSTHLLAADRLLLEEERRRVAALAELGRERLARLLGRGQDA